MRRKYIVLILILLAFASCDKDEDRVIIQYRVLDGYTDTEILWRDVDERIQSTTYTFESVADSWIKQCEGVPGQIVYLAGIYHDTASSVTLQISIDGKLYKQKSSKNEPGKYIVVSGTVPF
ncbi:MAG: hypothetical protein KDC05_12800 [Bacteroidales bacterium]|nr:hypothetical protein [Bacteroidales bacterium]